MQIYELSHRRVVNEAIDTLTTDEIKKIFSEIEKTSREMAQQSRPAADLSPIDASQQMTPSALFSKGLTAFRSATKPKITADSLYQTWLRNNKSATSDNVATMLSGAGISSNAIKNVYYKFGLPYGVAAEPQKPTTPAAPVKAAEPAPAPQKPVEPVTPPAATPAASKYASPTEVVDALIKFVPKDWLPQITAELLKRQSVTATGSTAKKRR